VHWGDEGRDRSPALTWSGAPDATRSFAITVYDPDAPSGSGWWHWAVANVPATVTALEAGAGDPDAAGLPDGAITIPNESRETRYAGAAPPPGTGEHRYFFTVSALSVDRIDVDPDGTPALLGVMLRAHVIARAQLVGLATAQSSQRR
jgi:Raf kinase inhibitor-like YbhB/YbcL family protein